MVSQKRISTRPIKVKQTYKVVWGKKNNFCNQLYLDANRGVNGGEWLPVGCKRLFDCYLF